MTAQKFIKRPDEFEAMRFDGDNALEIVQWATNCEEPWRGDNPFIPSEGWWIRQTVAPHATGMSPMLSAPCVNWSLVLPRQEDDPGRARTLEAQVGDWIINTGNPVKRWPNGVLIVMKPEAFAKAYAPVEPPVKQFDLTQEDLDALAGDVMGTGPVLKAQTVEEARRRDWSRQHPAAAQILDKPLHEEDTMTDQTSDEQRASHLYGDDAPAQTFRTDEGPEIDADLVKEKKA